MSIQDYAKAQKLAEKHFRQAVSHGIYPYLPALEDILRENEVEGQLPLGQIEIPISLIAGISQSERISACA
ncbi:MAG: BMP family ABC transporter substrate-binding protein, partial [Oscillospiraceae bacterium]|nr:BMP family ABC transporter substrate-binding protein [Oscillospiraceae bacterium]